ncbi:AraC family transcriptional regulator [Thalassospira sp. MCCC 1A02491]|uniref:helix-turn-helix domain-containing protein n=1 Tax=Thalassospira sp. MCCC 1A02491 TaxID=1769751 RepID=UPI0011BE4C36|nr:AraC family transcriptional regulator [Thalassospira sp. MCCC 1A02491]
MVQPQLLNGFQDLLEQYETDKFSVVRYAEMLSVTTTHVSRTVKLVTGKNAGGMMSGRLLLSAKRKLVFFDLTVSEIAYFLDFSCPFYFTWLYSKQSVETPKWFRWLEVAQRK